MQYPLPFDQVNCDFDKRLENIFGKKVEVVLTNNRWSILTSKVKDGRIELRIDRSFSFADEKVLKAVHRFVTKRDKEASRLIDEYYHSQIVHIPPKEYNCRTKGSYFDLEEIYKYVNDTFFGGTVKAKIRWGRKPSKRKKYNVILGTYCQREGLITMSPVLDKKDVPRYVVEYIIFHEICHHIVPRLKFDDRKGRFHSHQFKDHERRYPEYDAAQDWIKNNKRLLMG